MTLARRTAVLLTIAALVPLLAACSSGDDETGTSAATEDAGTIGGGVTTTAPPPCVSLTPGVVVPESAAVVRFSPAQVCPGFVTVAVGTTVTWQNDGPEPATVVITRGELTVASQEIAPGSRWGYEFTEAGSFEYELDVLPDFSGVVSVEASGAGGHSPGAPTGPPA